MTKHFPSYKGYETCGLEQNKIIPSLEKLIIKLIRNESYESFKIEAKISC